MHHDSEPSHCLLKMFWPCSETESLGVPLHERISSCFLDPKRIIEDDAPLNTAQLDKVLDGDAHLEAKVDTAKRRDEEYHLENLQVSRRQL